MEKDDNSLASKTNETLEQFLSRINFNFLSENSFGELISIDTTDMNNTIPFDRLKGRENYSVWKVGAKAHLIIKGLWNCCETALADGASAAEKLSDQKAIAEITLLLEPSNYTYIDSAKTAKAAWDSITAAFDDTGTGRKVLLLKQMVSLKMEQCISIEDYVNKMNYVAIFKEKVMDKRSAKIIKTIIRQCPMCFKLRMTESIQLMASLPLQRTTPSKPFSRIGVDYAGPVTIRSSLGRLPKLTKAWIAVFVCVATRAIHLELVSDATTKAFIAPSGKSHRGNYTHI
jgi:gag-polypeptide of LTR copia-type